VQPARLAATVRARLAEAGRDRHRHAAHVAGDDLELVPLANRGLVDVAGENELRARLDERGEDVVPARDGLLPRAPRRADQMVVKDDDAERSLRRVGEQGGGVVELALAQATGLVTPGADRVEPDDQQLL
jgi:hypothetical protein